MEGGFSGTLILADEELKLQPEGYRKLPELAPERLSDLIAQRMETVWN
jgi:hypothetical protein